MPSGRYTEVKPLQPEKAWFSMVVSPITVTLSIMLPHCLAMVAASATAAVTEVNSKQPENALSPMVVVLPSIVTPDKLMHL
jgi:hypothetical protein